jgi:hypothetical protein
MFWAQSYEFSIYNYNTSSLDRFSKVEDFFVFKTSKATRVVVNLYGAGVEIHGRRIGPWTRNYRVPGQQGDEQVNLRPWSQSYDHELQR